MPDTNYLVQGSDLTSIANAIRTKGGTSAQLEFPDEFIEAIGDISTGITPTGTKNINSNGTHDVTQYASANVQVPNTYAAGDEGKVVDDGALVAQTSTTFTQNGTYDTTTNNSVTVNVSGGGDTLEWKASRAGYPTWGGIYPGKNLTIDLNNKGSSAIGTISISYMGMSDGPNGKLTFKNKSSALTGANMSMSDFLRQAPAFQTIDLGGLAPSSMTRWFRDWGSDSQDGKFADTPVKVENLCLDNLTSNNDSFSTINNDRYYHNFDVYFTGSFKTTMTLSGWRKLNAASWNRLIEHLEDYSQGTAHTLTVGNTILAMIDATHQALAAARGWTLA